MKLDVLLPVKCHSAAAAMIEIGRVHAVKSFPPERP
jgi:hypothetical protein